MDIRLLLARRYLSRRRGATVITVITWISVVGVTVGTASLVIVLSVMNGFYGFVRDMLVSVDPHVRIESTAPGGLANADSIVALVSDLDEVRFAAPFVEGQALMLHDGAGSVNKVVLVRGVDSTAAVGAGLEDRVGFGRFDVGRTGGRPGIVIGRDLGERQGLTPPLADRPGSQIALLSAAALERMLTTVFGTPAIGRYEVRGLYDVESVTDESHVFVSVPEAQRLFRMTGRVSAVELRLHNIERAAAVKASLIRQLPPDRYRVATWYDLQRALYEVMRLEKWGASLILMLIVVVAAFNMVGSLTMVVTEKRSDIGVLRAMGMTARDVRRVFQLEGLLIGVRGVGVGLAIGLVLAGLQQQFGLVPLLNAESFLLEAYPVEIQIFDIFAVSVAVLALCGAAGLYPARRAAAIEPARAVRPDA